MGDGVYIVGIVVGDFRFGRIVIITIGRNVFNWCIRVFFVFIIFVRFFFFVKIYSILFFIIGIFYCYVNIFCLSIFLWIRLGFVSGERRIFSFIWRNIYRRIRIRFWIWFWLVRYFFILRRMRIEVRFVIKVRVIGRIGEWDGRGMVSFYVVSWRDIIV